MSAADPFRTRGPEICCPAEIPDPGNTFRLTFRHRNGQQTGRINVGISEAEQFTAELAAAMTAIIAQLKSPPK